MPAFDVPQMVARAKPEEHLLDQWSFYDYKSAQGGPVQPPGWVGDHARRLRAYTVLDAYYRNTARNWMAAAIDDDDKAERREYGDPFIIVESILSSLLGNNTKIVVTEAQKKDADAKFTKIQDEFDKWSIKEKLKLKMKECERNSIKLGDGVYVLGWNKDKNRCVIHVFDPGMYFPDLDARNSEEEFADVVHIAYEYEAWSADKKTLELFVRRMTWKLVPVDEDAEINDSTSPPTPTPLPSMPWNDKPIQNCWFEDKTWLLDSIDNTIEDFTAKAPRFVDEGWLGLDFIPVIHIPTTYNSGHYGISCLAPAMQVFDDIVNNDTDLQSSASIVGSPPIAVNGELPKGPDGKPESYGPGTVYETTDNAGLQMMDTSRSLDALIKYDEKLGEKLSRNSRVPKTLLGDVDPSKVPSGVVLTLSYAPHSSLIREMREIRDDKYGLFNKFVFRFMWKNGIVTWTGDEPEIKVVFGSYLPADRTEASGIITTLLNSHAISTDAAVAMLIEAGYPIDNAQEEVRKIVENDWKTAGEMMDATGDIQEVRKRMGLSPSGGPALAQPVQPGAAPNGNGPTPGNGNIAPPGPPPAPVTPVG